MKLLEIYEEAKKIEKETQKNRDFNNEKEELQAIMADIVLGKNEHFVFHKKIYKKLGIRIINADSKIPAGLFLHSTCNRGYIKLNKTNITKIQKYIDENKGK